MVVDYLLYFGIYFLNQELPIGRDSIFHSICSPGVPKWTSDEAATLSSPVGWLAALAQMRPRCCQPSLVHNSKLYPLWVFSRGQAKRRSLLQGPERVRGCKGA